MTSIYETTGKGYKQQGDYVLPNIGIDDEKEYHIGVWGQRYRKYLKQNHKVIYYNYLTSGKLYEHLSEVDSRAEIMFNDLVKSLAEKENITEQLKATSPMIWVQKLNNIRSRASEIVIEEVFGI